MQPGESYFNIDDETIFTATDKDVQEIKEMGTENRFISIDFLLSASPKDAVKWYKAYKDSNKQFTELAQANVTMMEVNKTIVKRLTEAHEIFLSAYTRIEYNCPDKEFLMDMRTAMSSILITVQTLKNDLLKIS